MTAPPEETATRRVPCAPLRAPARDDGAAVLVGCLDGAAAALAAALVGLPGVLALGYGLAVVVVLARDGSYRPRISTFVGTRVPRLAVATLLPLPVLVLLAVGRVAPWAPVATVTVAAVLVCVSRVAVGTAQRRHRRRRPGEPVVVIGAGPIGRHLVGVMRGRPELGLHPVGVLDDPDPADRPGEWEGPGGPVRRGPVSDLPGLVTHHGVRRVVVACAADVGAAVAGGEVVPDGLEDALYTARAAGARVWVAPRLPRSGLDVPLAHLDDLWGTTLVPLRPVPGGASVTGCVHRVGELVLAVVLCALSAPLVLAAAALTGPGRLAGPGPAFFRQWRVGRAGVPVRVVKVRTVAGDEEGGWTVPETRVTAWGRMLRRTHVDELPQLLGVLRGDLALVGPRPERPVFAALFARTVPGYLDRLRVRAGLTGWAQVHGLCGDTSVPDRARFDSQYVAYRSAWLDTVILLRTLVALPAASPRGPAGTPDTPGGRP